MRKYQNELQRAHGCVQLQKKAFRGRFINNGSVPVSMSLRPIIRIRHYDVNRSAHHNSCYTSVHFPTTSADSVAKIADIPPQSAYAPNKLLTYTCTHKINNITTEGGLKQAVYVNFKIYIFLALATSLFWSTHIKCYTEWKQLSKQSLDYWKKIQWWDFAGF